MTNADVRKKSISVSGMASILFARHPMRPVEADSDATSITMPSISGPSASKHSHCQLSAYSSANALLPCARSARAAGAPRARRSPTRTRGLRLKHHRVTCGSRANAHRRSESFAHLRGERIEGARPRQRDERERGGPPPSTSRQPPRSRASPFRSRDRPYLNTSGNGPLVEPQLAAIQGSDRR